MAQDLLATSLVLDNVELDVGLNHAINRLGMTVRIDWLDGTNERFTQATDVRWQVTPSDYERRVEIESDTLKVKFSSTIDKIRTLAITTNKVCDA